MKNNFLKYYIAAFFLCSTTVAFAQPSGVDETDGDTTPTAPIDGGITLLVAAGVLYGAKKVNDRRNN
jgi:hypothetical protein